MTYNFHAFISYSHHDTWAAKKLQTLLEGYNIPTELQEEIAEKQVFDNITEAKKGFKVFRDIDELTSGILSEELQKKLDESKFLIVICSEHSANSEYVGEEITYFRSLGRERQIIPFVIGGNNEKGVHDVHTCMHRQLTMGNLELLAIDINAERSRFKEVRFHKAFIRVVAKMLDLDFGVLWNKRKHKLIRKTIYTTLLSIIVLSTIGYLAFKVKSEQPFNASIVLNEAGIKTTLPLIDDGSDTVFLYLDENDVRKLPMKSLADSLSLPNIPGRYKDNDVRVVCSAFGCIGLDTIVSLTDVIKLDISRNPETFGRIRHYVKESDGETPVAGAEFDFGYIKATTDETGLLDVLIPLEYQKPKRYDVKVFYKGQERKISWQPELDPQLNRTEIYDIILE